MGDGEQTYEPHRSFRLKLWNEQLSEGHCRSDRTCTSSGQRSLIARRLKCATYDPVARSESLVEER